MSNKNDEREELRKKRKQARGLPYRCGGSFLRGTACGACERCEEKGYTKKKKAEAIEAEKERTKHLPADRVKTRRQDIKVQVVMPEEKKEKTPVVEPVVPPKKEKDV